MKNIIIFILLLLTFYSCGVKSSPTTGWEYNNPLNGGFQKVPYIEQETGPGLILIEGGTFATQLSMDDTTRTEVIVPSYYMDITEVSNLDWCEYLYWTERTFCSDFTVVYYNALPDTNLWRDKLGYSEPMEVNYLRHPSYRNYPVVGISWMQANNYCAWRTDRVNENILIREGVLVTNPMQQNEPFTTGAYLAGQYESGTNPRGQMPDIDPSKGGFNPAVGKIKAMDMATRIVKMEDGILLPRYRLPTEAEWEYAAYGNGVTNEWSKKEMKQMQSRLDLMGNFVKNQEGFNFNGHIVAPVDAYLPNDYGLYNMAGNVSEWVMDVYEDRGEERMAISPLVSEETKVPIRNINNDHQNKYEEVIYDASGIYDYLHQLEEVRKTKKPLDYYENELFCILEEHVRYAKDSTLNSVESSRVIRKILDDVLYSFNYNMQAELGHRDIDLEVIPMIRIGISKYVIDTPGNIRMRELTPEEQIFYRNNFTDKEMKSMTIEMIKKDSLMLNPLRVYKGASWEDETEWMNPYARRSLNKYESSATIGFRCAMDRVGSPTGISKKNKNRSNSKTALK